MANEVLPYAFQAGQINEQYGLNIINLLPTKAPYENLGYRDHFNHPAGRADRRIWMRGRDGFRNAWENTTSDGIVTDVQEQDGVVYYLLKRETVVELHAICDDIVSEPRCISRIDLDCNEILSLPSKLISQHTTTPCMYDKFVRTSYVKERKSGCSNYISGALSTDGSGNPFFTTSACTLNIGDFVLIVSGTAKGFVRMITSNTGPVYSIDSPTIVGMNKSVTASVFTEYGEVLAFASSNGIRTIAENNACELSGIDNDYTVIFGNTGDNYLDPTDDVFESPSLFNYQGQLGYISGNSSINKKGRGFANFGRFGFNGGYFTALTAVQIPGDVSSALEYNNIVILFSPTRIGYLSRSSKANATTGVPDNVYSQLTGSFGIYSENSFAEHLGDIVVLTNQKRLFSLGVEYFGNNAFGDVMFRPKITDLGKYIQAELDELDFGAGDMVWITQNNDRLSIFINNPFQHDESATGGFEPSDTKILHFDSTFKFWYKWIVCGVELVGYRNNIRYGKGMFVNCGTTDNANSSGEGGTEIVQLLGCFLDASPTLIKSLNVIKGTLGDESVVTDENTRLRVITNLGGLEYSQEVDTFASNEYTRSLMDNMDANDLPYFYTIFARNDVTDTSVPSSVDDTEAFCGYSLESERKPINEQTGEQEYENDSYTINSLDTSLNGTVRVGRYGTYAWNIDSEGEMMYVEMVSRNGDRIHTNGFDLMYEVPGGPELVNSTNSLSQFS